MIKEIETKAGGAATVQTTGRQMVLRSKIKPDPHQPRQEFKGLEELAASLTADGFLECLKVREEKDHYVLIDGERRLRAAQLAGIERVPVEVISAQDVLKVQLLFGTQRANLSALEQAHTAGRLLAERRKVNPKFSVEDLAKELSAKRAPGMMNRCPSVSLGYLNNSHNLNAAQTPYGMEVEFKLNAADLPSEVVELLKDYHAAQSKASIGWQPKQLRQQIRDGLNQQVPKTERVSAMLASPEMRQALEATLTKLNA